MFSWIPLGVHKTLLHGGGVISCGTYDHQSGAASDTPHCVLSRDSVLGGRQVGPYRCFLLIQSIKTQLRDIISSFFIITFTAQNDCWDISVLFTAVGEKQDFTGIH